ncbi:actin-related protein 5-like [Penaeus chinensis]|uniref:actin-related protein 5-like n=1 Tax=Penaeus chinensis TaxID=139456 RepID=UPI001FB68BE6|nr:actin-related protein 5-like [Penaeus chinensis]
MEVEEKTENIFELKDARSVQDPVHEYGSTYKGVPLIIDNGSYNCRVGWATDQEPRIVFRNCYAKHRKDRGKKLAAEIEVLVANDISNIEAVRFQLKSPHDENIVTHYEAQETMFDYTFAHLGIDTPQVDHPIVLTEAFCNPNYSRQLMSELLFECYGVPSISYCVDGLLSYHRNNLNRPDGLLVNIGNYTTHVTPVLDGFADAMNTRRIRMGGLHLTKFLWRWLQLRFPQHLNAVTLSRAEEILHTHMYIADDYMPEIAKWSDVNYFEKFVRRIQLPYVAAPISTVSVEQQRERRKEAARRLVELNAKKREEKLIEDEAELTRLVELEEAMEEFTPDEPEYQHALEEAEVSSPEELTKKISVLQQKIDKTRQKMLQASNAAAVEEEEPKPKRVCEEISPKKRADLEQWVEEVKQQWREIQARRAARRHKRQEMAKRRTAASQERMRIISQLARREKKDDNFGMRDEDWDVYKAINKEGGGSDSEEENEKLQELESALRQHSPEFLGETTNNKPTSVAENYQLLLSTEQIRIGELLFQPYMYGLEQGGITATIQYVLGLFDAETQDKLVKNVFLTGGPASLPGLKPRIERELLAMRPFESQFSVCLAKNPVLDPWYGARDSADELVTMGLTRADYQEHGGDRIKYHRKGNKYWASLTPVAPESAPGSTVPSKETTPAPEPGTTVELLQNVEGTADSASN